MKSLESLKNLIPRNPLLIVFSVLFLILIFVGDINIKISEERNRRGEKYETLEETPDLDLWRNRYPNLKHVAIESDSVALPALLEHPGKTVGNVVVLPEDGWLISFEPEVVGGPKRLLHHADFLDMSSISQFCKNESVTDLPTILFASGKELTSGAMPPGYGYPLKKGAEILYNIMLHNPDDVAHDKIKMRLNLWYIPKKDLSLIPVTTLYLSVAGPCIDGDFAVPPETKQKYALEKSYLMPSGGKIVAAGAHLHDFGEYVELKINGKTAERFVPKKNFRGEITTIYTKFYKSFTISPGDKLTVETSYNNTSQKPADAMAGVFLVIAPESR